jgi:uncharacterized lipoprotein YddW (UPF0748 family)
VGSRNLAALLGAAVLCATVAFISTPEAVHETRALWVTGTTLASPAAISAMVDAAADAGFNTLIVQVRRRGDAYYGSSREPRATQLSSQPPDFDPLATTIALAHPSGLKVHAWLNVNLVSSAATLPAARTHLVHRHPEWLMVPRRLAAELAGLRPGDPAYLRRLAAGVRAQSSEVEGLYVSPIHSDAADHMVAVATDVASRYALDGIHFDYVRYPNAEFDYSRRALSKFREWLFPRMKEAERKRFRSDDIRTLLAMTDAYPVRWSEFRRSRLTSLVSRLQASVKRARPGILVSAAVFADSAAATALRLQEWQLWVAQGYVDVVCPMAYTTDSAVFATQIAEARAAAGSRQVWAGIGAYRLPSNQTVANIETARRLGAEGIVLFSYESMLESGGKKYLADVNRGAFAR